MPLKGKEAGPGNSGSPVNKTTTNSLVPPSASRKTLQPRASSFQLKVGQNLLTTEKATVGDKKKASDGKKTYSSSKKSRPTTKANEPAAGKKEKPIYDKAATQKFNDMIDGDLSDLPPLPKSMVRVFLSSTFSDMRAERNMLANYVYPHLRQFCASVDLDFQVVDMRWGVREDSQNDHCVEKLCLLEVENCQNMSRGPNFVVLSGDRYGFRPIPTEISVEEYDVLHSEAEALKIADREKLDEWYKLDENAMPPVYLLQPIRSKFTFFADYSPGCDEPRKKDTADWWKTFETLQSVLRQAAESAHENKKLSADRRHQYFLSVTECEIQEGILNAADVDSHVLVYRRELTMLNESAISEENFSRYIDVKKNGEKLEIDRESAGLRKDLIGKKIPAKSKNLQTKAYSVTWKPGGIDPREYKEHKAYLEIFCSDFINDMAGMIKKALMEKQQLIQMSNYYSDYEETIHHLKFCNAKCETFCGQQNVLDAAKTYILDESARKPLVIHAQSGAGKTSVMAMIMKSIPVWLKDREHVKLIRFLGTTPNTINIYEVLFSVLGQLSDSADLIMSPVNYKNMKNLVEFIPRHLRQVASTLKMPVIILLDSVDQLGPFLNAYSMEWLPTTLPPNVKLILSTLPEEGGILNNLRKLLPDKSCYVEVPALPESTGKEIIEMYLRLHKRKLTESQLLYVLTIFKGHPTPLFLKLLLDEARKWNSYSSMGTLMLAQTVKEAIDLLFKNLEKKFGYTLVSHALGYITLGLNGLTEFEIEDVLSCDDKVLDEVYKFHDPPVPGIVRIPPVLWTRIHFDIKEYLVERVSYGKRTLNWYHRQFIAAAREQYTSGGKDVELHKNLMHIYLQDEGIKRTITLSHRKNLTIENADRQVTPQPFSVQNRRKLSCLPYHLSRAYQLVGEVAKKSVYCNFKFLCAKIAAFSVKAVKDILADFIEKSQDDEAADLLNFLTQSKDDLRSPIRFAVSLLAYIQPTKSQESLIDLQNQAKDFLREKNMPLLIPVFPCLTPREDNGAVTVSAQGYSSIISKTADSVLLKVRQLQDSDAPKAGFSVFDSEMEDFTPFSLSKKLDFLPAKLSFSGKKAYYVTETGIAEDNQSTGEREMFLFSQIEFNCSKNKEKIMDFSTNAQGSHGIVSVKKDFILANLSELTASKMSLENIKPSAVINKSYCTNSETNPKGVLVGKIVNSEKGDVPQGPENQSFIATVDPSRQEPVCLSELESSLCPSKACLLGKDEWFVIVAHRQGTSETEHENCLVGFQLFPLKLKHDIKIPSDIVQVLGNPDKPEAVALGADRKLYVSDMLKGEITLTVETGYSVSSLDVLWEKSLALVGSANGMLSLYDLKLQKALGSIMAHNSGFEDIVVLEESLRCVTLGKNGELKLWSVNTLLDSFTADSKDNDKVKSGNEGTLLDQTSVTSIEASAVGNECITCSSDGYVRVWSVESQKLLRKYNVEMAADVAKMMPNGSLVLLDRTLGKLLILDIETGKTVFPDPPKNVVHFTTKSADNVYSVSKAKDGVHLQIDVLSLKFNKISKTITLQKELPYVNLDATLTDKGRYMVLRVRISEEEYNTIAEFWKKKGAFAPQPHRHKFVAVDLTEGTGGMLVCYRQLSKIPTLGTIAKSYQGNIMMITTRRWVVFWDIVTGKCDQKTVKTKEYKKTANGMMYRPEWLGQECEGTTLTLEKSPDGQFVAAGSEDGYMFIYGAESGVPRGNIKPSSKHPAEVIMVVISPDSKWVVSTCRNSTLKLWHSASGKEQFMMKLDAEVSKMMFTPDSKYLLVVTGSEMTRVLLFQLHVGTGGLISDTEGGANSQQETSNSGSRPRQIFF